MHFWIPLCEVFNNTDFFLLGFTNLLSPLTLKNYELVGPTEKYHETKTSVSGELINTLSVYTL